MFNILFNEIYKIFARKKLYVFMIILMIVSLVIGASILLTRNMPQSGMNEQPPDFSGTEGKMFPLTLLDGVIGFILPIFVTIIVADMITD